MSCFYFVYVQLSAVPTLHSPRQRVIKYTRIARRSGANSSSCSQLDAHFWVHVSACCLRWTHANLLKFPGMYGVIWLAHTRAGSGRGSQTDRFYPYCRGWGLRHSSAAARRACGGSALSSEPMTAVMQDLRLRVEVARIWHCEVDGIVMSRALGSQARCCRQAHKQGCEGRVCSAELAGW